MPRRREVPKRRIIPDPKFKDKLVTKFTNTLMLAGKKSTAEGILYGALDVIRDRYKEEPLDVFRKALDNTKPNFVESVVNDAATGSQLVRATATPANAPPASTCAYR